VLIAASIAVRLQSIVAREIHPGDAAVITVGFIQAGTKNNIIPDQAQMGLTVRSYKPEVRKHLLSAIERIARAEAQAAGAEKPPPRNSRRTIRRSSRPFQTPCAPASPPKSPFCAVC